MTSKPREFYVDRAHLEKCDRTLGKGEGLGCRVVYYPREDDLENLVKVIDKKIYDELKEKYEKLLASHE